MIIYDNYFIVISAGTTDNNCLTISGGTIGAYCIFPFKYQDRQYNGCTIADASDGKEWCSTQVDTIGQHVGNQGFWGHCNTNCPSDLSKDHQNQ